MSEWRSMKRPCMHCGGALEAKPLYSSFMIAGFEPMEYRHKASGKKECWLRREAEPYDPAKARDEWEGAAARREWG